MRSCRQKQKVRDMESNIEKFSDSIINYYKYFYELDRSFISKLKFFLGSYLRCIILSTYQCDVKNRKIFIETYKRPDLHQRENKIVTERNLDKARICIKFSFKSVSKIIRSFCKSSFPDLEANLRIKYNSILVNAIIVRLRSEANVISINAKGSLEVHTCTTVTMPGFYARLRESSNNIYIHQHGFINNNYDDFFIKEVFFDKYFVWDNVFKVLLLERYGKEYCDRIVSLEIGYFSKIDYQQIDFDSIQNILYLVSMDLNLDNKKARYERKLIRYLVNELTNEKCKCLKIRLHPSQKKKPKDILRLVQNSENVILSDSKALKNDLDLSDLVLSVDSSACDQSLRASIPTVCILENQSHAVAFPSVVYDDKINLGKSLSGSL